MYELVLWPEVQDYMMYPDFHKHACLANDEYFVDTYGSQAYFIEVDWIKTVTKLILYNNRVSK